SAWLQAFNAASKACDLTLKASDAASQAFNVALQASNVTLQASNVTLKASNVFLQASNVSLQAFNVTLKASNVTLSDRYPDAHRPWPPVKAVAAATPADNGEDARAPPPAAPLRLRTNDSTMGHDPGNPRQPHLPLRKAHLRLLPQDPTAPLPAKASRRAERPR